MGFWGGCHFELTEKIRTSGRCLMLRRKRGLSYSVNEEDNDTLTKVKYLHASLFSRLLNVSVYNINILDLAMAVMNFFCGCRDLSLCFRKKLAKNAKYAERKTCFGDQSDSILKAI